MASFPWTFPQAFGSTPWSIDGSSIKAPTTEVATHQSLVLGFRVTTSVLENRLRPLKANEGQLSIIRTDSGGFRVVDRAGGNNTYDLTPPPRRTPLRYAGEYHVDRYEESLVSQAVDEWDVEVAFVPTDNRTDSPSISGTIGAGDWGLETRYGTIATPHVDAEFLGMGRGGVERFELIARLSLDEAHALEAALSLLEGARIRQVVDAPNVAVDDTSGDANTIDITSPVGSVVPDGEYIALSFESERQNDAWQSVTLQVAAPATAGTGPGTGAYGDGTYNAGTYNQ